MHHCCLKSHIKERVHARKCECILSYHREDILDVFIPNVIAIHMRESVMSEPQGESCIKIVTSMFVALSKNISQVLRRLE